MKRINYFAFFLLLGSLLIGLSNCSKNVIRTDVIYARTHTVAVNWFRDSTTANPTAFIDLYNGKAYTYANAATKADSIDFFTYDHSALAVSGQNISLINLAEFSTGSGEIFTNFHTLNGNIPFSAYNTSTFSEVSISSTDFNNLKTNTDIANLFSSKALNGGYGDGDIASTDLGNTLKYYQFKCAKNGKRGIFHVIASNYLPGGTMTIEVKVEQ